MLMISVKNIVYPWQELQTFPTNLTFYKGCDALEVKNNVSAPPEGWGVEHAISALGSYFTESYFLDGRLKTVNIIYNTTTNSIKIRMPRTISRVWILTCHHLDCLN